MIKIIRKLKKKLMTIDLFLDFKTKMISKDHLICKLKRNFIFIIFFPTVVFSQISIEMEKINGIYMIPCKVNGLSLRFVLDTGASNVSISKTEALFMLKNGYLSKDDIGEKEYYSLADGKTVEGLIINLKNIEIGDINLTNVKASIVLEQKAPLLLGQTVLEKLGTYKIDGNKLILEDYNSDIKKSSVLDEKNGFKSLKLGTHLSALPFFKNSEFIVNEKGNKAYCHIKDAPGDLKTVFDLKMDAILTTFDYNTKILIGIELVKVYKEIIINGESKQTSFNEYKYINDLYSKALKLKPTFFSQDFLNSNKIAAYEGAYAYYKGNNVLLSVGVVNTGFKLTEENDIEHTTILKINYYKIDNESIESLFEKF